MFDFDNIKSSEQNYRLLLSEVKATANMNENLRIRLEGADNRINVAKKRHVEAVAIYNATLEESDPEGTFKPMKHR